MASHCTLVGLLSFGKGKGMLRKQWKSHQHVSSPSESTDPPTVLFCQGGLADSTGSACDDTTRTALRDRSATYYIDYMSWDCVFGRSRSVGIGHRPDFLFLSRTFLSRWLYLHLGQREGSDRHHRHIHIVHETDHVESLARAWWS